MIAIDLVAAVVALWALWAWLALSISALEALFAIAAAFAIAVSAHEWRAVFIVAKPAATALSALAVLPRGGEPKARDLLFAALFASLIGDALLLRDDLFVAGLVAFLVAHLIYVRLFLRDARFLASKVGAALVAAYALAMLAYLWPHLDAGLKLPVVAYLAVISTMAAQALGRYSQSRDRAAGLVALGALFFVASDSLLALTTFAGANPTLKLGVLPTYWLAQGLISFFVLPRR